MERSEVSTSVVKCSEGLSNRVSIVIRRYIEQQMNLAAYIAVSFITFFLYSSGSILYHCIYGCMFCMLPFNCKLSILIVMYVPVWIFCFIV